MYAITSTGWRSIKSSVELLAGETAVEEIPQTLLDSLNNAESQRRTIGTNLRAQADQALVDLRTFRDLTSPTNAQVIAAVKLLCRVAIGLIRLQLNKLDGET